MNAKQKLEFLEQSKAHFAADMLLKGTYAAEDQGAFKGCSVGCHIHHIKPKLSAEKVQGLSDKHAIVAKHYGYPEWLALLQDQIFEGLPNGESAKWHIQLAETLAGLPPSYNWQTALHRVHAAILRISYRTAGSAQEAVKRVLDLHERAGNGERVTDELWNAAESAAESAAWSAAWSAARSAAYQEIRDDVLDAVVPMKSGRPKRAEPQAEPARATKERVTFQLPIGLIEKARDVVFFSPGLTMASFMEEALVAQIDKAEKKHGKAFPSRAGAALKTGRPVKAA